MTDERKELYNLGKDVLLELETDTSIMASGKDELYGVLFGRDSLITCLLLLRAYNMKPEEDWLRITKKTLTELAELQGKEVNIESGEEPGKIIHEYRESEHEFLTRDLVPGWYVYDDGKMKIYDSIDSTSLFLMTVFAYYKLTKDEDFLQKILPAVKKALDWIFNYSDHNGDGLVDYEIPKDRKSGGIKIQSWMDSNESLSEIDIKDVVYPVSPIEAMAYTAKALSDWEEYFEEINPELTKKITERLEIIKRMSEKFIYTNELGGREFGYAIDGTGRLFTSARSSIGHVLYSLSVKDNGEHEDPIYSKQDLSLIAERLMKPDMFASKAGIRTLSRNSEHYDEHKYHNGTIWPHDSALCAIGLEKIGYKEEAQKVWKSLLTAFSHFKTPYELYVSEEDELKEYLEFTGHTANKKQAWSAAAMIVATLSYKE